MTSAIVTALPVLAAAVTFATVIASWPVASRRMPRRVIATRRTTAAIVAGAAHAVLEGRRVRRLAIELADDVPDVVDLLAVAVAAGANLRGAVSAAATHHGGPVAAFLSACLADAAVGSRLADAVDERLGRLPSPCASALRPLVTVLLDADRYGAPLGPALLRLGDDARLHRHRRAEERARRLPVRLLLPLVLCILPAFALLTVAPLLAGVARGALADTPPVSSDGLDHVRKDRP